MKLVKFSLTPPIAALSVALFAALSSFGALPEGYVQLRYIQSDGSAWINTKYNPNETTRIETDIDLEDAASADQYVFGADDRTKKSNAAIAFRTHKATTAQAEVPGTGYGDVTLPNFSSTEYRAYRMEYETGVLTVKDKLTGESFVYDKSASFISSYQFVDALYVFSRRGSSSSLTDPGTVSAFSRVRSFRIYDGGALVRDFVPALRLSDGAMGFYDVSDHSSDAGYSPFYGNAAASGRLCSGPDADEMSGSRRLAYVEVTDAAGSQYVDTGYVFRQKPQVVARLMITGSAEADLMGTANKAVGCFLVSYNDGGRNVAYRYSTQDQVDFAYDESLLNVWTDFAWSNVVWHGAAKVGEVANWDFSSNAKTFRVFRGRDSKNACTSRIAAMKVYDGDELVFDFFPAMVDGVPGLYDSLTKTLYPSSGSKPLEAGPVVPTLLVITGSPIKIGEVSPAYGVIEAVEDDEVKCTASAAAATEGARATLLGWDLYSNGEKIDSGDASPANLVVGSGVTELRWRWQTEYLLATNVRGSGAVEIASEWVGAGNEAELTAVADDGYAFSCWEGDVPVESRHENPLKLKMDAAKTLTAVFSTARYVDFRSGVDDEEHSSETAPWKTLAYAVAQANEGDELVLAKGVHEIASDIIIEKRLTIRGAGRSDETTLDAKHNSNKYSFKVVADGCLLHDFTLYRLGAIYQNEVFQLKSDSVVSNVAFTACGNNTGNNQWFVLADKGLITCCYVTNNIGYNNAGFRLNGTATVENCLFRDNQVVQGNDYGHGILDIASSSVTVRNCTIVNNRPRNFAALAVRSGYSPKVYNNIIWGNVDYTTEEPRNWSCSASKSGWLSNCTSPLTGLPEGNISEDPKFKRDGVHLTDISQCRNGKANEGGVVYATAADIDGIVRANPPCMGAFEYVQTQELEVTPLASATFARLPDVIRLSCNVSGAVGKLTYAWSFNDDGTVDSTEAEPALDRVGIYHPSVTVRDEGDQEMTVNLVGEYVVHSTEAITIYVSDEAGDDETGDGSYDKPFKTAQKALTAGLAAGDEVVLKKGVHRLTGDLKVYEAITIRGEGESWETTIDAEHKQYTVLLSADGLMLCNFTFYRLGAIYQNDCVQLLTDAVVSNVAFTACGNDTGNNQWFVLANKGLITCCYVTNNIGFNNAGFHLEGSVTVENCLFRDNQVVQGNDYGHGVLDIGGSGVTVRNCTIVNNRPRNFAALAVRSSYSPKVYNNIIWGNVDYTTEEPRNWSCSAPVNWLNNCTTTNGLSSLTNIEADPLFVDGNPLEIPVKSPCRNKGDNALGSTASVDILGNPRIKGRKIDIGCVECQNGWGLGILVR